jgi:Ran GTPase-activating protein (RanGAP) involved in mRNA processing and transport
MDYEKSLFGMTFHDMVKLAKGLNETNSLTTLTLHRNKIDDDMCRMLSVGMQNNQTVTYLDLSHNHIADRGLRSLTQCLLDNSVLTDLRMASNEVSVCGGGCVFENDTQPSSKTALFY